MAESSADVVRRYLEDAITAEKSLEAQLTGFAAEAESAGAKQIFERHASETRSQHERLAARLKDLGTYPPAGKSLLASVFDSIAKTAHRATAPNQERTSRNLVAAFAAENGEIAMYEALASISEAAGDTQTAALARSIQHEHKSTAQDFWQLLQGEAAR